MSTTFSPQRALPSAAGASTSTRTSTSPPQEGTRVSLGRSTIPSPVVASTVGWLVARKRPSRGRMNPMGARQGSLGSRATTGVGLEMRSVYSTPFAVNTEPLPPCCGITSVPSRARRGPPHPTSARQATTNDARVILTAREYSALRTKTLRLGG